MPAYYDEKTKSWFCKFYYTDYTGARKQKKKRGFSLKREAQDWERVFLEKQQGTPDMTFQALYEIYMEDMAHRLRESTTDTKKSVFKNRILPHFKDKPINSITPADIRAWQNIQIAAGYSDGYLCRIHRIMSALFNYAITYYNLPSNPCVKAGRMGKDTHSVQFWTLEQYNRFIQHIEDIRAHTALELLFYSGMRFGEMMALTLSDFDFTANTISITKTYHRQTDRSGPPKTDNGVRHISMPPAIMQEIQAYISRIYGIRLQDRVFTFSESFTRNNIQRGAKKAEIPCIRIHDLRHSHVSLLIDLGFSPHLIAERIGDTVQMVNSTYGHLYPNKHEEVADRLNQLIVPK